MLETKILLTAEARSRYADRIIMYQAALSLSHPAESDACHPCIRFADIFIRASRARSVCSPFLSSAWRFAPPRGARKASPTPKTAPSKPRAVPTVLDRIAPFRRCLWVTRWDYTTEADLVKICYNAASARFTDVLFQVRGAGTVFYPSAIEPWAPQLAGATGRNPGWDPLAVVIREAHKYGLRVHAYMNVLPAASATETDNILYTRHRSWLMRNADGRTMSASGGFYAFLDPGLPDVREYLARLFAEVAAKYPIDGIHLDYIRYPDERGDYSYHPKVVADFRELYGRTPSRRPEQWDRFRRRQVTQTIEAIAAAVRKARPGIELSAAVVADPSRGYVRAHQSPLEWLNSGLLDAIAPMAYSGRVTQFEELCAPYRDEKVRGRVWLGVWADPGRNTNLEQELRRAISMKFGAVAVFSYSELFPAHQASSRARQVYQAFVSKQTVVSQATK